MDEHDITEQAFKNGYSAGYVAGRRSAGVVHGQWEYGKWEQGHWVKGNERCRCSVCHRDFAVDNLNIWHGCPQCLAIMDLPQITEQTKDALMKMGENAHGERR